MLCCCCCCWLFSVATRLENKELGKKGLRNELRERGIASDQNSIHNSSKDLRKLHKHQLIEMCRVYGKDCNAGFLCFVVV